ncbi:MAG: DMT family transporter [Pseudomonadota bacterium]|nr:DMT family transporter [Pseudomonadota bacterium]
MQDPQVPKEKSTVYGFSGKVWDFVVLILLGVFWGLSFSLARMSTETGLHPLAINYWTCLISTLMLLVYCIIGKKRLPLQKNFIFLYIVCAILGSVIPGTLYFYAASHVSAGVLSITIATVPLATFVGAALFKIEKASLLRVIGVLFGILSITLLVLPDSSMPDPSAALWVLVMVVAAGCYAIENLVIAARMPPKVNVFVVVTGMLVAATIMLTPIVWITGTFGWLSWPLDRSGWAIFCMAIITATAYGGFYYLVVRAGPVFASQTAYVVTLAGVLWGMLIYSEAHSAWVWASLVVMIIALSLVRPQETADTS